MTTTWNTATDISCNFSNGNLTAALINGQSNGVVAATLGRSSGKYYFEISTTLQSGVYDLMGLTPLPLSTTSLANSGVAVYTGHTYGVTINGSDTYLTSWSPPSAPFTCCIAVDLTNNLIWFRFGSGNWNNSGTANPATGTGGLSISSVTGPLCPSAQFFGTGVTTDNATLNVGATAFNQTMPSGFSAWDPAAPAGAGFVAVMA